MNYNNSFRSTFLEIFSTSYVNEFGDFELAIRRHKIWKQYTKPLDSCKLVALVWEKNKGNEYLGYFRMQLAKTSKFLFFYLAFKFLECTSNDRDFKF